MNYKKFLQPWFKKMIRLIRRADSFNSCEHRKLNYQLNLDEEIFEYFSVSNRAYMASGKNGKKGFYREPRKKIHKNILFIHKNCFV